MNLLAQVWYQLGHLRQWVNGQVGGRPDVATNNIADSLNQLSRWIAEQHDARLDRLQLRQQEMARRIVTEQQQEQTAQGFASVNLDQGTAFRNGVMYVHGREQRPERAEVFESSNGMSQYTAIIWIDDVTGLRRTSCNCPGWAFKKGSQARCCKHTKAIESGVYDKAHRLGGSQITSREEAAAVIPEVEKYGKALRTIKFR